MAAFPPIPPLPQVPAGLPLQGVPPPPVPTTNPPTLVDVTNAYDYTRRLEAARIAAKLARGNPGPTPLEMAESLMYQKAIMELIGPAGMPPWFQQWNITQFLPLRQDVTDLTRDVTDLRREFANFRGQTFNARRATGHQMAFETLNFINGDDPTMQPHNLPRLQNNDALRALTAAELTAYLTGYGLSAQGNPIVRSERLATHIGYRPVP
ncbi:hypothetical protein B0H15DRAFT_1022651 [Mycena belliarum]|uniref:Mug135-like C-terminal domain-containing protein n=1 Tax=Mycena belliarum TaxID=1033014 RepID=A0AAD6U586_9AGAR|nr:hypothetical protein B0H15DRAFT_1022651 [Mycena belliae]